MIRSLTLLPKSIEPQKMEELLSRMIPSMKKARGLKSLSSSAGHLMSPGGPPAYSRVIESSWDSLENFMVWAQNQKPDDYADRDFMLENGAILLYYEVKEL